MEDKIRTIIQDYEAKKLEYDTARDALFELTGKKVEQSFLDEYWRSQDLKEVVHMLAMKSLENWQHLSDEDALVLVQEILDNVANDALLQRNCEALEKRFSKPTGTISNLVFYPEEEDLTAEKILEKLKKGTVIRL